MNSSNSTVTINAEDYAGSLAHVVKAESGSQDVVLGQAWLCGAGQLATCGHVVDAFTATPNLLYVFFPLSGNRYPVSQIRLHPSFVRQQDQLVRFDAALLSVSLAEPDSLARPLPITYEKTLPVQLPLTAVRYPVHLGQFSSSMNPLAQMGRLLGPLRKHDNFHLLHDLALSPGDSGAAIFAPDGSVVAMHYGDTATLPGLNLPTTSIRLALWVDALRDLAVDGQIEAPERARGEHLPLSLAKFILAFSIAFAGATAFLLSPQMSALQIDAARVKPVVLLYNKSRNGFTMGEPVEISLKPGSDCHLYLFDEDPFSPNHPVYRAFPQDDNGAMASVKAGESISIKMLGPQKLRVNDKQDKLHLFAVSSTLPALKLGKAYDSDPSTMAIQMVDNRSALDELKKLKDKYPEDVLYTEMDGPVAKSTVDSSKK